MNPIRRLLAAALAFIPAAAEAAIPVLTVTDALVTESEAGSGTAIFTVELSAPPDTTASVDWATVDCTASAGNDYVPASGRLVFPPGGPLSQPIAVEVLDDPLVEGAETFGLVLSQAIHATLGDDRGEGVILDDDGLLPGPPAKGDFNGDGRSDLLVAYDVLGGGRPPSRNIVWAMTGPVATELAAWSFDARNWAVAGVADFDLDGDPDLLLRRRTGGLAFSLSEHGEPRLPDLRAPVAEPADTPRDAVLIGVADFDGDARSDVLLWHPVTGQLYLWYLVGTAISATGGTSPAARTDTEWRPVATGDFDGDLRSDILWRHQASGDLEIWRMAGAQRVAVEVLPGVADLDWEVVAAGDFNGDRAVDLLWQHRMSRRLVVWFLAGRETICSGFLSPDRLDIPGWGAWEITGPR